MILYALNYPKSQQSGKVWKICKELEDDAGNDVDVLVFLLVLRQVMKSKWSQLLLEFSWQKNFFVEVTPRKL